MTSDPSISLTHAPTLGRFLNPEGFSLTPIRTEQPWASNAVLRAWLRWRCGETQIYRAALYLDYPLTLALADGVQYQTNRTFETDMGSVPLMLQSLPGGWYQKDRWIRAYLFHDDGYGHGGLWVRRPRQTEFHFEPMSREKIDALLKIACLIEGAPEKVANRIHYFVDRFGGGVWDRRRPARVAYKTRKREEGAIA